MRMRSVLAAALAAVALMGGATTAAADERDDFDSTGIYQIAFSPLW
ncbi:hypothetical protein [Streptomyces sp. MZ04]|nr:hypothetical protein [Streptomyces sp. MZ04]